MEDDLTGCWVAYYHDRSGAAVFKDEIDALRYAVERNMEVKLVHWGHDIFNDRED